jgi:nitroreductase
MPDYSVALTIEHALEERFGELFLVNPTLPGLAELAHIAGHSSHRRFKADPIEPALLRLLCACALSAPSKSDLQQADILIVKDAAKRDAISALLPQMPWTRDAPVFLVFLANGRRLPQLAERKGMPFPNDHLDQFFNASVDAGIVLATFIRAAEAVGLGCCPISVIRDHAAAVSDILALPERVFPVAGLCAGWPHFPNRITPRLPLAVTLHEDVFDEANTAAAIDAYDRRRESVLPYATQRDVARFNRSANYGWSEDKARQYAIPQRADFGAFVRAKGFKLD